MFEGLYYIVQQVHTDFYPVDGMPAKSVTLLAICSHKDDAKLILVQAMTQPDFGGDWGIIMEINADTGDCEIETFVDGEVYTNKNGNQN